MHHLRPKDGQRTAKIHAHEGGAAALADLRGAGAVLRAVDGGFEAAPVQMRKKRLGDLLRAAKPQGLEHMEHPHPSAHALPPAFAQPWHACGRGKGTANMAVMSDSNLSRMASAAPLSAMAMSNCLVCTSR